jgi:hypothetical protein
MSQKNGPAFEVKPLDAESSTGVTGPLRTHCSVLRVSFSLAFSWLCPDPMPYALPALTGTHLPHKIPLWITPSLLHLARLDRGLAEYRMPPLNRGGFLLYVFCVLHRFAPPFTGRGLRDTSPARAFADTVFWPSFGRT